MPGYVGEHQTRCDCVVVNKQIVGWLYMEPAFNIVILISEIQENKELIKIWLFDLYFCVCILNLN